MAKPITEDSVFKLVVVFALFLLLAFNRDLALIYISMLFADYLFYKSDKHVSLVMERSVDRLKSVMFAIGGYAAFFILNAIINSFANSLGLASVFNNLASTTPILEGSQFLTFMGWGVLVPIVETRFFFGRLFEAIQELIGESPDSSKLTQKKWFAIGTISGLFALFHITSKNMQNVPLLLTFIFGAISCILIVKEKQLLGAVLLHLFTNSTGVLYGFRPELFSFLPMQAIAATGSAMTHYYQVLLIVPIAIILLVAQKIVKARRANILVGVKPCTL